MRADFAEERRTPQKHRGATKDDKRQEQVDAEHRGGCDLWGSIRNVVCLSLNMRSSGVLGRILEEMRAKTLQDDTWRALQDRVLGVVRRNGDLRMRLQEKSIHAYWHHLSATTTTSTTTTDKSI